MRTSHCRARAVIYVVCGQAKSAAESGVGDIAAGCIREPWKLLMAGRGNGKATIIILLDGGH